MGRIERSRIPVGIAALAACLSTASAFTAPLAAWPVQSLQGLGAQGGSTGRFRCVPSRQSAELRMAGEEMFDEGAREELAIRMLQQQLSDDWLKTRLKRGELTIRMLQQQLSDDWLKTRLKDLETI
ncbi:hypothetical protein T484DRAFT_1831335 [Baffinella frigidus]|nr:hypothetical protein T484DRAFT_1831335 [Cryptophyta sp. CCMP2293]